MADDHAAHAIGADGSRINATPSKGVTTGTLLELRAELGRLSDEVGDTEPGADPRRARVHTEELA